MTERHIMNPYDVVEAVLAKYTSPDGREVCCKGSELRHDLESIIRQLLRQYNDAVEIHHAWLRLQKEYSGKETLTKKIFG